MLILSGQVRRVFAAALLVGTVLAGGGIAPALAQTPFDEIERARSGEITFATADRSAIVPGSTVAVSGHGFRPGQSVTLHYGTTALPGGVLTADAEGKVTGTFAIPADAVPGIHPITVVAANPFHTTLAELKVSPNVPLSGQDGFRMAEAQAARGLYQSAYSEASDALFVTAAIGRPPVRQSELVKLDPDTLEVLARTTPAAAPPREGGPAGQADAGVYAVYGVGVDDANGRVWVTNTRHDTVAVYSQDDLSLVKQFEPGTVTHGRDVKIDQQLSKVYVSALTTPEIKVFDTKGLTLTKTIAVNSLQRGEEFSVASLSLDQANHRLYAASLGDAAEVAIIDTRTDTVEKVFPVPGARSVIGISHDPQTGRIYVAAQGTDNLIVLDGTTGEVIADTPVGAGALNVAFDPMHRRAYVSSRGAGTITVTDPDGRIIANLGPAPLANHVALGPKGTIYAVDNSATAMEAAADRLIRIEPIA